MTTARRGSGARRLVVYVTSHGFGHLNRTAAVLNRIPATLPVTIRGHSNLFDHWRERLTRDADLAHYVSDVGAVNPPGDSAATDAEATMTLAAERHRQAMARLDIEVEHVRALGAAAVLCDAPAVPLIAAARAGVPGFLTANFTWADIYAPYARSVGTRAALRLVAELRQAYRQAVLTFRTEPALRMSWLRPRLDVGMVVHRRRDRRAELRRLVGIKPSEKLVYIYIGRYGQDDLDWSRLARVADRGIHFVGYPPAPGHWPANLHLVPSADWPGGELIAASDAVVAKAGYGTVCEAMASRKPMIYPPRHGFSEYRVLDRAVRLGGRSADLHQGLSPVETRAPLEQAITSKPGPPPYPTDGADRIARHLTAVCRGVDHSSATSVIT